MGGIVPKTFPWPASIGASPSVSPIVAASGASASSPTPPTPTPSNPLLPGAGPVGSPIQSIYPGNPQSSASGTPVRPLASPIYSSLYGGGR